MGTDRSPGRVPGGEIEAAEACGGPVRGRRGGPTGTGRARGGFHGSGAPDARRGSGRPMLRSKRSGAGGLDGGIDARRGTDGRAANGRGPDRGRRGVGSRCGCRGITGRAGPTPSGSTRRLGGSPGRTRRSAAPDPDGRRDAGRDRAAGAALGAGQDALPALPAAPAKGGPSCPEPTGRSTPRRRGLLRHRRALVREPETGGLRLRSVLGARTALGAIGACLLEQLPEPAHLIRGQVRAQPSDRTSACSRTVSVAFSCLSGG